jgi:predicted negative regulator of RcsB-dependent stress response
MKSIERHKLETNWLAKHLNEWIDKLRPYTSTIAGVSVALVVVIFTWSMFSGASTTREKEAWDVYQNVIGGAMDDRSVAQLGKSAEEFSGTDMQPWASVTRADGQVWTASRGILQNREAALKELDDAASAYQAVIVSAPDEELVNRARFGLARIAEMRNQPDRARDEYLRVTGSFSLLAKQRADALAEEKTRSALAWLEKAESPRMVPPPGPGVPGMRPGLDVDDINLPGAAAGTDPTKSEMSIDELFKGLNEMGIGSGTPSNRYGPGETPATGGTPAGEKKDAPADDKAKEGGPTIPPESAKSAEPATPPEKAPGETSPATPNSPGK